MRQNRSSPSYLLLKVLEGSADFGFGDEQMLYTVSETQYGSVLELLDMII